MISPTTFDLQSNPPLEWLPGMSVTILDKEVASQGSTSQGRIVYSRVVNTNRHVASGRARESGQEFTPLRMALIPGYADLAVCLAVGVS